MIIFYAIPIFFASALLFCIQPLVGKILLPEFGSSPTVWNSCMLFFQICLLLGYTYADNLIKIKSLSKQIQIHLVLLLLSLVVFFYYTYSHDVFSVEHFKSSNLSQPLQILYYLATTLLLPLSFIAASSPLLQRWYSCTKFKNAHNPYPLYAISNFANIFGLVAYLLILEPWFVLQKQYFFWQYLLLILLGTLIVCGVITSHNDNNQNFKHSNYRAKHSPKIRKTLYWLVLSFIPASLLLSVTQALTINIAPIPLLWVVPLVLYLLSFVFGFNNKQVISFNKSRLAIAVILPPLLVFPITGTKMWTIFPHLIAFFLVAYACHKRLYQIRPNAKDLTFFYFTIGIGGILGNCFNTFIAPLLFNNYYEHPIIMVLGLLCISHIKFKKANFFNKASLIISVAIILLINLLLLLFAEFNLSYEMLGMLLLYVTVAIVGLYLFDKKISHSVLTCLIGVLAILTLDYKTGDMLAANRNFFGVQKVIDDKFSHILMSGNTMHGRQYNNKDIAMTYYKPVQNILKTIAKPMNIIAVGLGSGTIACLKKPNDTIDFVDINPEMIKIAKDPKFFTYLQSCPPGKIILNDGRLALRNLPNNSYDVIILDAFSGDTIPVHMLTLEAIQSYSTKLKTDGFILVHVSNRYINLKPVLNTIGNKLDLSSYSLWHDAPGREGVVASSWVVLAKSASLIADLKKADNWQDLAQGQNILWTDNHSNILPVIRYL